MLSVCFMRNITVLKMKSLLNLMHNMSTYYLNNMKTAVSDVYNKISGT